MNSKKSLSGLKEYADDVYIKTTLLGRIEKWVSSLDELIGDTEEEIVKRREENKNAVQVREDLKELMLFIQNGRLTPGVKRALEHCVQWNPHAN